MLAENASKSAGKVRIIGFSIDQNTEIVKGHVIANGWLLPKHFHKGTTHVSTLWGVSGV